MVWRTQILDLIGLHDQPQPPRGACRGRKLRRACMFLRLACCYPVLSGRIAACCWSSHETEDGLALRLVDS